MPPLSRSVPSAISTLRCFIPQSPHQSVIQVHHEHALGSFRSPSALLRACSPTRRTGLAFADRTATAYPTGRPCRSSSDPERTCVWRVAVPMGRSSPIVLKDRVYLTAVEGDALATLAFDAQTGKTIWRRDIVRDHTHKIYVGNDSATPTPATDGESLYVFFPDLGLVSFDLDGKERWRLALGPFDSFYGLSSSPVVHGDTVALVCDQRSGSFAIAVDKSTGRIRWRVERKHAATEAYSTPAVYAPAGAKPQLIVTGARRNDGYDLATGENLWWIGKQGIYPAGSPVLFGDLVIAVSMGGDEPEYPTFDSFREKLDVNKDEILSLEEFSKDEDYKDHFGWLDQDSDGRIVRAEWDAKRQESVAERGITGSRIGGEGDRTASNLALARQEVLLLPDHAARLSRRLVPGQERWSRDHSRPPDGRGPQGRPHAGGDRPVLRLPGGRGREGVPAEPLGQGHGAEGGPAVGDPRGELPRRDQSRPRQPSRAGGSTSVPTRPSTASASVTDASGRHTGALEWIAGAWARSIRLMSRFGPGRLDRRPAAGAVSASVFSWRPESQPAPRSSRTWPSVCRCDCRCWYCCCWASCPGGS